MGVDTIAHTLFNDNLFQVGTTYIFELNLPALFPEGFVGRTANLSPRGGIPSFIELHLITRITRIVTNHRCL